MRARTAAPSSLLSATLFFNATRLCSDSIWKGAALRGEPTGCGVQRLGGELGKDSAAETRQGRSESGAGTAPAEPPGGGDGGGGHSAASQGMDAPSFDSLPPEKQVGRTPAVFWGHLGRAGEGGGRSAAVRSWAARLRAENRSAPFRQVMPACCGTSSVTLCLGETGKDESPLAALARASPGVSAAQGPTTFQCQLHETAPNAQGILEIRPKRAFEVFNPLSWSVRVPAPRRTSGSGTRSCWVTARSRLLSALN